MNCKKCGKEIPDGAEEICEECKQKVISELKEDEQSEVQNIDSSEKKEKSVNEFKETVNVLLNKFKEKVTNSSIYKKIDGLSKKIKYCICGFILLLIIILILILSPKYNKIGNTVGNIRNYGYVASEGKWIYYLAPNEDRTQIGVYRTSKNGKNKKNIFMTDMDIVSINAYKGYLYFIGINNSNESELEDDDVDNKIYRIKADGSSEMEILNNNEFNNECFDIYVIKGNIYYIGTDRNIYKMKLNGTDRQLVADNGTGYIGITDKYIVYNDYIQEGRLECHTLNGNDYDKSLGKGYGEYKILMYADAHSKILSSCQYVLKITGRIKVRNIKCLLKSKSLMLNNVFRCDFRETDYLWSMVVMIETQKLMDVFKAEGHRLNDSNGVYFEHILYEGMVKDKKVLAIPFFESPEIDGVCGTSNQPYSELMQGDNIKQNLLLTSLFYKKADRPFWGMIFRLLYVISTIKK